MAHHEKKIAQVQTALAPAVPVLAMPVAVQLVVLAKQAQMEAAGIQRAD
jgi:hypothetical protein